MSEQPERPAQPGTETHVPKADVAGLQAALDAAFNARGDAGAEDVERELRAQIDRHGVGGSVSADWVRRAAASIAAGEPVAAEPGDA
jgi:hypothetical protein